MPMQHIRCAMTNLLLMATLGLAATGAGFLVAPHAAAWVDAALDDCHADAQAEAHAFSGKHARAKAHAKTADSCEEGTSTASTEDGEDCEHEKAKRHSRAEHEDAPSAASLDVGVSVDA